MPFYGWTPYVSTSQRRAQAERELAKRKKQGHDVSPVRIEGRAIATTFWGKSWCENLEGYSDYENRLPRGRTYVRNGSVVDLQISPGTIRALVSGSSLYEVTLHITPVPKTSWKSICTDCAGAIDSLIELLQGRFSKGVMERICRQKDGLFPSPSEIKLDCNCPDSAYMCKHLAAVLYAVGARLDHKPELLFLLRAVDEKELIANAGSSLPLQTHAPATAKILSLDEDLSDIFGLEMAEIPAVPAPKKPTAAKKTKKPTKRKTAAPKRNSKRPST